MKYCKKCGAMLNDEDKFCNICGTEAISEIKNPLVNIQANQNEATDLKESEKSRAAALILCFFLRYLGIHNFYLGKKNNGIIQIILLLTSCLIIPSIILFVWLIIDFFNILLGSAVDANNKKVTKW